MAGTVTPDVRMNGVPTILSHVARGMKFSIGELVLDSSYATGGETCVIPGIPSDRIVLCLLSSEDGYIFSMIKSTSKVQAFYTDASTATDGVLVEVAASVDLSGVTVDFFCLGL